VLYCDTVITASKLSIFQ